MKNIYAIMLLCAATPSYAEGNFTVGGFVGIEDGGYVSDDDSTASIVPYFAYDTEHFHIGIDGLGYHVLNGDNASLSLTAASNLGLVFDEDNDFFDGMEREADLTIGLEGTYAFDGGLFIAATADKDISDAHGGMTASAAIGYETDLSLVGITVSAGAKYTSEQHNQYYYGISQTEARSGRQAFETKDAVLPFASIEMVFPVSDNGAIVGLLDYTDLSDVGDSPLLEADYEASAHIGFIYSF